ncbi:oligosaccharide repeat unit polymerase [Treponema bryantii]|uniref:oligosaccharide repeat unit polymerase n=1 Tax=Treponema bryantii TaxID=163 RepID=UPI0003B37F72|nr:oligosaccharide repeat unit polymerase [Treponema bryantii]
MNKMNTYTVNRRYLYAYFIISILPLIINFIWILKTHQYKSEFPSTAITVDLSNFILWSLFFYTAILYILITYIFFRLQNKRLIISNKIDCYFKRRGLEVFLFLIMLIRLVFNLKTGRGKAATDWTINKFSFLVNFFNISQLFTIYYLSFRNKINKAFIILVLLYCCLEIMAGWTGFVLVFFMLELFYRINSKFVKKYIFYLPICFFVGALAYQFLYPLKYYIRLGASVHISYSDAIIKLFERLSWFSHSCVGYQNSDKIVSLYKDYGYSFTEIKGYFRTVIPSFLFPNKDFRSLNNLLMTTVYPDLSGNTSSNFGQLIYLYNLFKIGIYDFILYFIILFANTFFYKFFMDMVKPNKKENKSYSSNYMMFVYFCSIFAVGSLENISYGWQSLIWTYMFLFLVGVIRVHKIKN